MRWGLGSPADTHVQPRWKTTTLSNFIHQETKQMGAWPLRVSVFEGKAGSEQVNRANV